MIVSQLPDHHLLLSFPHLLVTLTCELQGPLESPSTQDVHSWGLVVADPVGALSHFTRRDHCLTVS